MILLKAYTMGDDVNDLSILFLNAALNFDFKSSDSFSI